MAKQNVRRGYFAKQARIRRANDPNKERTQWWDPKTRQWLRN